MKTHHECLRKLNGRKVWIPARLLFAFTAWCLIGCSPSTPAAVTHESLAATPFATLYISPVPSQTSIPAIQSIQANLGVRIADLEKNMPRANTNGFIIPTRSDQQTFRDLVFALEGDDPQTSIHLPLTNNYEILKLSDEGESDSESYILQEKLPIQKGWGLYVFRINPMQDIVIEAPHPLFDKLTPEVALDLYRALNAKALLISGSHRNANPDGSADSAHAPESIFQTIHNTLFQISPRADQTTIFLQIHGFAARQDPLYPQVIIGHNWKNDPGKDLLIQEIAKALKNNNIETGICDDSNHYQDLCGRSNLQSTTTVGGIFIHIEVSESIRKDDRALIDSLRHAFAQYFLMTSHP